MAACIDTRDGPGRERLLGVYQYAMERNWRLFLFREDNVKTQREIAALRPVGAIFYDCVPSFQKFVKGLGVVCVETSARNIESTDAAVFVDDSALTRMAAEHLVGAGFEHLGYCGLTGKHPSELRGQGMMEEARRLNLTMAAFTETHPDGEMMLRPLIRWLRHLPKSTGVLAFDDKMGERVLAACRWTGLSVPGEVGVLGIGNDEVFCDLAYPSLSSVALPTREIGYDAAKTLEAIVQGRSSARGQRAIAPFEVVARASTDRMPSTHPVVVAAIRFIREEIHHSIGTDQVAAAVKTPRRTLERWFQAELGHTVHEILVETRLRMAKRLLRRPGMTMSEIAAHCGYSALSAFTRMFAACTGVHPMVYRKQFNTALTRHTF